jgi:hypothetical protein
MPEYANAVASVLLFAIVATALIVAIFISVADDDSDPPKRGRRRRPSKRTTRRHAKHTRTQLTMPPHEPEPFAPVGQSPAEEPRYIRPVSDDELADPNYFFPAFADIAWAMPDVDETFKRVLAEHTNSEEEIQ